MPEMTIAVEKVFWAFSLLTTLGSFMIFSVASLTPVSYPLFIFPDQLSVTHQPKITRLTIEK